MTSVVIDVSTIGLKERHNCNGVWSGEAAGTSPFCFEISRVCTYVLRFRKQALVCEVYLQPREFDDNIMFR